MKNIKSQIILMALLLSSSFVFAQGVENNGRETGAQAAAGEPEMVTTGNSTITPEVFNGSDQDVPGDYSPTDNSDWVYPEDLSMLQEEMNASATSSEVAQRMNLLSDQVAQLIAANEALRQENQLIRQSLNNCCSVSELGFSASDAYILQNTPNPFQDNSTVKYFVPQQFDNAQVEVRDIKGELLHTLDIPSTGLGEISLKSTDLATGTYIYTLVVAGELIDSKVMIITK